MVDSTAQTEPRFEYTPLDTAVPSIRLLTLFPDREESQIRCDLATYTWNPVSGDINRCGVDGVSGHGQHFDQPSSNESSIHIKFAYITLYFIKLQY